MSARVAKAARVAMNKRSKLDRMYDSLKYTKRLKRGYPKRDPVTGRVRVDVLSDQPFGKIWKGPEGGKNPPGSEDQELPPSPEGGKDPPSSSVDRNYQEQRVGIRRGRRRGVNIP